MGAWVVINASWYKSTRRYSSNLPAKKGAGGHPSRFRLPPQRHQSPALSTRTTGTKAKHYFLPVMGSSDLCNLHNLLVDRAEWRSMFPKCFHLHAITEMKKGRFGFAMLDHFDSAAFRNAT